MFTVFSGGGRREEEEEKGRWRWRKANRIWVRKRHILEESVRSRRGGRGRGEVERGTKGKGKAQQPK